MREGNIKSEMKTPQILLIGNNPMELSSILDKINQIHGIKVITEIAFDMKTIFERLLNFKPNYILIDDNIGQAQLTETVKTLSRRNKTRDIPITVLKNSNYQESFVNGGILDYLLKANLSAESLYNTLKNSLKFRRTREFLRKAYRKRGGLLDRIRFDLQA